jgi:glycosyltransferase involved in cell wall biosynthesis
MAARPIAFAAESFNNPVAESGAGLTAPPEDPVALAEVILQLEGLPAEQRIRMGQNGRRWVLAHHDLAKIARRWEEFLVAIVGMPRRAAEKPRELKRAA